MRNGEAGTPEVGTVVVGVDGSSESRSAALWAAAEANRRDSELYIVYGADLDRLAIALSAETVESSREAGRALLVDAAEVVRERYPKLRVVRKLSRREPVDALLGYVAPGGCVVVGNRGRGGFSALLLGSVGLGVATRSEVPVVVVRGDPDRPDSGTVTAAVHGETDLRWLRHAARETLLRRAELRLVSVWNVLGSVGGVVTMLDDVDELAQRRLQLVAGLAEVLRSEFPGLTVHTDVKSGRSASGVLVEASRGTDLLVVGGRRRARGLGSGVGRVAHALIHHAHCPVEVVPVEEER
ncbi:universal stress protein [Streptomyces finlayi]|uniref:Universal stress protein n=1 Tax=Streptomyces finlayi TaxID=67296 RepID=A0A7G7BDF8_9ACTN|nr:universal stress protein [Streptomyces finlayi]QNE73373.1 universal stress protein [Streptomyces finlayi]